MTRSSLLVLIPLVLAPLLLAQASPLPNPRPPIDNLAAAIQTDLTSHGDRILGNGLYSWSTRLNKIDGCRAELSVQVTNNNAEPEVRTETVNFSLGAIAPPSVELRKSRLELPCTHQEKCIFSTSTCSVKTKSGIVIDCATPSQKRVESFTLELDGDGDAAARLERAFRQAVDLCHSLPPITF
jgi:hypothetical protein